ncbi:MAG: hypothetical protein ABR578_14115 [Chromatocurvus sp.]
MDLLLILLLLFIAVALMVFLGERFAKTPSPEQLARLRRWLIPLVGAVLVLSLLDFYWG